MKVNLYSYHNRASHFSVRGREMWEVELFYREVVLKIVIYRVLQRHRKRQVHAIKRYSRYQILWLPILIWCPGRTKLFTLSDTYWTMMGMVIILTDIRSGALTVRWYGGCTNVRPTCMSCGTITACKLFPCQGLRDIFAILPQYCHSVFKTVSGTACICNLSSSPESKWGTLCGCESLLTMTWYSLFSWVTACTGCPIQVCQKSWRISCVINSCVITVFSPILLVSLNRSFTGVTVEHFHQFFTGSPVKNSLPYFNIPRSKYPTLGWVRFFTNF